MQEDIELIDRYIAGDGEAIEKLVMKYQKNIYALIYRMINDMEEAKDLTQKTFVRAVKGIRGFRKEASFKTWLYQIAINQSLNHIEKNKHKEVELEESMAGNQKGILSAIIEKEIKGHIKNAIDALPKRQQLAIILRVYDGLSCDETAQVMGCSEGAVKAHYHNAVKRLREILKERGYEVEAL